MTARKIIGLLLGALAISGAACFLVARSVIARAVRCDETAERPVWSPDGASVAASTMKACPAGLLSSTNCSVYVTLGSKSETSSPADQALIFQLNDAAEEPTLTWLNGNDLVLELNDVGEVQVAKHELGSVRIRYSVPKRIWDNLKTIETDRLRSERESEDLYKNGKISKDDLRVSSEVDDAVAKERSEFRQWIIANATVEAPPR